ncbi:unnamed protein product [Haemonchus placei]|uniref:FZ domain-containing protein n=1 Tax=Haemonchus placei TaxID=6290 RepID=A0A0N4X7S4_HAEPC|nr:unnamed protein product [Haemonchus placei]
MISRRFILRRLNHPFSFSILLLFGTFVRALQKGNNLVHEFCDQTFLQIRTSFAVRLAYSCEEQPEVHFPRRCMEVHSRKLSFASVRLNDLSDDYGFGDDLDLTIVDDEAVEEAQEAGSAVLNAENE